MKQIVLFGVGRELKKYIGYLKNIGIEPYCFADNNPEKWGTVVEGKTVVSPEKLKQMDCNIMISCSFVKQITNQLEEMGIADRIVDFQPILKDYIEQYADKYDLKSNAVNINEKNTIIIDAFDGIGWGGMEVWSYNVGYGLSNRGYDVEIYGSTWQAIQEVRFEQLIKRFELNREDFWTTVETLLTYMEKKLPFTLINNWTEHVFAAAYILKKKYPNYVKIISIVHNDTDSIYKKQILWENSFDKIAGVSRKICTRLVKEYSVQRNKVFYKENFVERIEKSNIRTREADSPIRIGWGARVEVMQKRADLIAPVIEKLEESGINYVLEIAGGGFYRDELLQYIDKNQYSRVKMLGEIPVKSMGDFWRRQDIYINLSDFEGSSLAMLEAMSTGCVPVVTDVSGTDEFVINGISGFRCKVESVDEIVERIVCLYKDNVLLHNMSYKAAKIISKKCRLSDYISYMEELIQDRYDVGMVCCINKNIGNSITNYALYQYLTDIGNNVVIADITKDTDFARVISDDRTELYIESPYNAKCLIDRSDNKQELSRLNKTCNIFIVGSDQLWRNDFIMGTNYHTCMDWVDMSNHKLSYATSFGVDKFEGDEEQIQRVKFYLKRLHNISVREKSGVSVAKDYFDVTAEQVVDPVFLCDKSYYEKMVQRGKRRVLSEKFVGAYILDVTPDKERAISDVASCYYEGKHLSIMDVDTNYEGLSNTLNTLQYPKVEEWLTMIHNSDFFITDSFHGLCFALIFKKPFCVMFSKENWRGITRIESLLKMLGLEQHLVTSYEECIEKYEELLKVDFGAVDVILQKMIFNSKKWMFESMKVEDNFSEHKIVGWGAGDCFNRNYDRICAQYDMKYVCDSNPGKWGKELRNGIICISPAQLAEMQNVDVLIMVDNYGIMCKIADALIAMKKYNFSYVEDWLSYVEGIKDDTEEYEED